MERYIIGIDLGTGSAKAIALDHAGKVIDTAQVPYPTFQPKPNYQEQAPELVWQAFLKCISRITASRQKGPDALEKQIATPVIALSLLMRYRSLEDDTFSGKVIAALRNEFGGHAVERKT